MSGRLNNRGASFLFALAFFLVCCLGGSSVFAMAHTYGMRGEKKQEKEAEYLAVLSAADFLKEQIEGCSGVWEPEYLPEETENKVQEEILKEILQVCQKDRPESCVLTLDLEGGDDGAYEMNRVKVLLTVQRDGDMAAAWAAATATNVASEFATASDTAAVNVAPASATPSDAAAADGTLVSETVPVVLKAEYFVKDGTNPEVPFISMTIRGTVFCEASGTGLGKEISAVNIQWEESHMVKGDGD